MIDRGGESERRAAIPTEVVPEPQRGAHLRSPLCDTLLDRTTSERHAETREADHDVLMRARKVSEHIGGAAGSAGEDLRGEQRIVDDVIVLESGVDVPIAEARRDDEVDRHL